MVTMVLYFSTFFLIKYTKGKAQSDTSYRHVHPGTGLLTGTGPKADAGLHMPTTPFQVKETPRTFLTYSKTNTQRVLQQ